MQINLIDGEAMGEFLRHDMRKAKKIAFVKGCIVASAVYVLWILLGYLGGIL